MEPRLIESLFVGVNCVQLMHMRRFGQAILACAVLFEESLRVLPALAQSAANYNSLPRVVVVIPMLQPVNERVTVDFAAEDGARPFEVRTPEQFVIAQCAGHCQLSLVRGHYNIYAAAAGKKPAQTKDIEITHAANITFGDRNSRLESTGLALGLTGIVVASIGLLLVASTTCIDECTETAETKTRKGMGLGGLVAGAVMIPVGFVLRRQAQDVPVHETPWQPRVGISHLNRGGQFELSWQF
jgi:hypothetical protein